MNTYKVNYDKRCIYLTYDGKDYSFHLDNGDVGDFWHSFFHRGQMYDINFHQEDSGCRPSLEVYKCKGIDDGLWEVDTSEYEVISLDTIIGDADNYFNNI